MLVDAIPGWFIASDGREASVISPYENSGSFQVLWKKVRMIEPADTSGL